MRLASTTRDDRDDPSAAGAIGAEPPLDCSRCLRLCEYRHAARLAQPDWHNAPVLSFGDPEARLLIVGLAPGLRGANRTGRPFTGDYAGQLLYGTLIEFGFARGPYDARADDGLVLLDCMITNAVRCVPPENKPTPREIATCRAFLARRIAALPTLSVILALGRVAHDSTLAALELPRNALAFAHGAHAELQPGLRLFDSYHCSRYNTNTRKLTPEMFRGVFAAIRAEFDRV